MSDTEIPTSESEPEPAPPPLEVAPPPEEEIEGPRSTSEAGTRSDDGLEVIRFVRNDEEPE